MNGVGESNLQLLRLVQRYVELGDFDQALEYRLETAITRPGSGYIE